MTSPSTRPETFAVALSTDEVTLVVDLSDNTLPAVVHWGPNLDTCDADDLGTIVATGVALSGANDIDVSRRVAVLPEQHRAWPGRPGLQGSRSGRAWSTKFVGRPRHAGRGRSWSSRTSEAPASSRFVPCRRARRASP